MVRTHERGRGGRQAEAHRNDQLVLDAARAAFMELGADAPVSVIAERAGVGMGTLYRRYPTKEDLLRQVCVTSMQETTRAAGQFAAEADAWTAFAAFLRHCLDTGVTGLTHLAGTFTVTAEVTAIARAAFEATQALVDRTHAEGGLRPGITAADVFNLIAQLRTHQDARERYLTLVLDGLCGTEPLPGTGASWQESAEEWTRGG